MPHEAIPPHRLLQIPHAGDPAPHQLPQRADPPETGTPYTAAGLLDPGQATGLAVDGSGDVYVAHRDRVSVYDTGGAHQLDIGVGSLRPPASRGEWLCCFSRTRDRQNEIF